MTDQELLTIVYNSIISVFTCLFISEFFQFSDLCRLCDSSLKSRVLETPSPSLGSGGGVMSLKVSIGESGRHSVTLEKDRKKRSKVGEVCGTVYKMWSSG